MLCELTSQNISLRDKQTQYFIIGNSTAGSMEINERMDIYLYDRLMSQPNIIHRQKPLTRLLEVDSSATSSSSLCFEIRSETSLTEDNVSLRLKRLASDPSFRIPSEGAGGFRPVKPIQGKGIVASKLLVESRR